MSQEQSVYRFYQSALYRIGWRVQYRARATRQRELPLSWDHMASDPGFSLQSVNRLLIEQLLQGLPAQGRAILVKLYLLGLTEAEVAKQLNISQQAVNKWKKRMLRQLYLTMNC